MLAQDPNRYSSEGVYSWGEPSLGRRLEWKSDPWRYLKLALIPLTIFGVAAFCHLKMERQTFMWLSGISASVIAYIWLWTFAPRQIRLFEDRVAISRFGRGLSWTNVFYSDIQHVEITSDNTNYRVTLKLKTGKFLTLVSPDKIGADRLNQLFIKNA